MSTSAAEQLLKLAYRHVANVISCFTTLCATFCTLRLCKKNFDRFRTLRISEKCCHFWSLYRMCLFRPSCNILVQLQRLITISFLSPNPAKKKIDKPRACFKSTHVFAQIYQYQRGSWRSLTQLRLFSADRKLSLRPQSVYFIV